MAATLPSSLDDFMAGVPKSSTKTEVKTVTAKSAVKDTIAALNPQKTVESDKPKIKITPKEEAKKTVEKPNKHIVAEGDSLSAIAVKYHLKMDDLKEWIICFFAKTRYCQSRQTARITNLASRLAP